MKDVLICIDNDKDRAVAHVNTTINLLEDEFRAHVVHVFQDNPESASIANFAAARPVKKRFEDAGIEVVLHERSGDPGSNIVDLADELDVDLISIVGRKRSPTGKVLFGSVAQDVILSTDRSVLICDTVSESEK